MILDELDPAVLEQLSEQERQQLAADAQRLGGLSLRTHMAASHPNVPLPPAPDVQYPNLQPGQMFSYSTRGPGQWNPDSDIAVGTPDGRTLYAPGNARNISYMKGPPGPSQEELAAKQAEENQKAEFARMMSGVNIKNMRDAQIATQMSGLFMARRQYEQDLKSGMDSNEAARRYMLRSQPFSSGSGRSLSSMFEENTPKVMNVGGRLYRVNPAKGEPEALTEAPGISPYQQALLDSREANRDSISGETAFKAVSSPSWDITAAMLGDDATNVVNAAKSAIRSKEAKATEAEPESVPTETPFKDGTILRKKDGSRWIVRNGKPVPLGRK